MINHPIRSLRWQRVLPGIYATFTGELPIESWWWAAHLYAGDDSYLADRSAIQALKLQRPALPVFIGVPQARHFHGPAELVIVRQRGQRTLRQRPPHPPILKLEHAVLDVANSLATDTEVLGLISDACNKYSGLALRVRWELKARKRQKHRNAISSLLDELIEGATTALEIPGKRRVLVAHGLPTGRGQVRDYQNGKHIRRDRVIDEYGIVVEFDGRLGHTDPGGRFLDSHRDISVLAAGGAPIRLGWQDVHDYACESAVLIAELLISRGWPGIIRRCGPGCRAA